MALVEALPAMPETGPNGFEGLVQRLINVLTGLPLHLARSGDQLGRDVSTSSAQAAHIAIECKRYGPQRRLNRSELITKIVDAATDRPDLDGWILVTTRDVNAQLSTALRKTGEQYQVEVSIIATDDGDPSTLEVLCSAAPDTVVDHLLRSGCLHIESVRAQLEGLGATERIKDRREQLRDQLMRTAAYEWCRRATHAWLRRAFSSEDQSRAAFGQIINVADPVSRGRFVARRAADAAMNEWWRQWPVAHDRLVICGGEGEGKTWTIADWTNRALDSTDMPVVLWMSARQVLSQDPADVLSAALAHQMPGQQDLWSSRLRRWIERPTLAILLVLDGINEAHGQNWWRGLFDAFAAKEWREHVALLATARSGYWRYFSSLRELHFRQWTLAAFDDDELETALRTANLGRQDLPTSVLPLARKPRYFDLVVRHRARLAEAGDVTVARLIYEDWQDRFLRKGLVLDPEQFHNVLRHLARQAQDHGAYGFSERQVRDALPAHADAAETVTELATSGIFVEQCGQLRVDERRLVLGFGLLLADRIRDDAGSVPDQLDESIAQLLEPHVDTDLKASICESATVHALLTPEFPKRGQVALLRAWILMRNQRQDLEETFPAYFAICSDPYFGVAEEVWRNGIDEPWVERLMMRTFLKATRDGRHSEAFVSAFERWLGFVHVSGPPGVPTQSRARAAQTAAERLGRSLTLGSLEYKGLPITIIDDDGLMRLGRVALAVISVLDRRPFARALAIGYVAEALSDEPQKYDALKWVVRTGPADLTADLLPEALRLIACGTIATQQATYRILTALSQPAAIEARRRLPDELFPHPLRALHEQDPCASGFAWSREECQGCADREDVNPYFAAQQIGRYVLAPSFELSSRACERIAQFATSIDPARIHAGPSYTETDHHFEVVEPVLCRYAPSVAAELVRAAASTASTRPPLALRQLLHFLNEYHPLVLRQTEYDLFRRLFDALRDTPSAQLDTETERARWQLVALLLPGLTASGQLTLLIDDPNPDVLVRCSAWIRTLPEEAQTEALDRAEGGSLHHLQRTLFVLSQQPVKPSHAVARRVVKYVNHDDAWIRGSALKIVLESSVEEAAMHVVNGPWHWRLGGSPHENLYGSLLLTEWGSCLTYEELRTRIDPAWLGVAVDKRGCSDELAAYAQDFDATWQLIVEEVPPPATNVPPLELAVRPGSTPAIERVGLADSEFSHTTTYVSWHAAWGGDVEAPQTDRDVIFGERGDEYLAERQERLRDVFAQQQNAGNLWFGRRFRPDAIHSVLDTRPELLPRWLAPVLNPEHRSHGRVLHVAHSFYETLCQLLLELDPPTAVKLYECLRDKGSVRIQEEFTGIRLLELTLFAAQEHPAITAMWNQRLDAARTNAELLVVAVAAQRGAASQWLKGRIERDLSSERPLDVARAITLLGFIDGEWAGEWLQRPRQSEWAAELMQEAREMLARGEHARHWCDRFLTASDTDEAWAAFRLFLRCVDSRLILWWDGLKQGADPDRIRFFYRSIGRINEAIKKNQDELSKHFLGHRVMARQVWPWLEGVD